MQSINPITSVFRLSSETAPDSLDIRTYGHSVFGCYGKSLEEAENPFQLSRAWASLLGVLVITFTPPRLIRFFIRVAICVPIWIPTPGCQPGKCPTGTCGAEKVRDPGWVPG